jgi:hypothetical protein
LQIAIHDLIQIVCRGDFSEGDFRDAPALLGIGCEREKCIGEPGWVTGRG